MHRRLTLIALVGALTLALLAPATALGARPGASNVLTDIPVTGTTAQGPLEGLLDITEISIENGQLLFSGVLDYTVDTATGEISGTQTFTDVAGLLDLGGNPARCDILFLDLGPLHLDLLGLNVDLSQVTLDVFAVPGPGNLLGNLLCAVAGLLDGPGLGLGGLLDRLLDVINDLLG